MTDENQIGERAANVGDNQIVEIPETKKKSHRLFLDDTEYQSFIRRLAWSPDGQFLLTPGSWFQDLQQMSSPTNSSNFQYTVYGFLKTQINKPAFMLPGIKSHATCIRFSPYLYQLKERQDDDPPAMLALPYRMMFAIATVDNILLYQTQSIMPVAILKSIHYDSINDMSWMGSSLLMTASSDGFCSFLQLDSDTVGSVLDLDSPEMPEDFKDHYRTLYSVNFQSQIDQAMQKKEQGFAKIAFKSKKTGVAAAGPAPATAALVPSAKIAPVGHDRKVDEPSSKKDDDICMQDQQLIDSSPAENTEKGPLSPLTWINPASDAANAPNSGHLNVEESSGERSNLERGDQKDQASAQNERDAEML